MRIVSFAIAAFILSAPSFAHDKWANGQPVPEWVKQACCGASDVHHIPPEAIHLMADGYHIDGIATVTPVEKALPSPDGEYWVFWNEAGEPNPSIFCFFSPLQGV